VYKIISGREEVKYTFSKDAFLFKDQSMSVLIIRQWRSWNWCVFGHM